MSVARSSDMLIGRLAHRREGGFPTENALSAGKGDGNAQRGAGRSMLSTIALIVCTVKISIFIVHESITLK